MSKYTLLDFTSSWCGPCKIQKPILEELKETNDLIEVKFIDVDECPTIANKYNITVIPTLIIKIKDKEIIRYTGITSKEKILTDIEHIENKE